MAHRKIMFGENGAAFPAALYELMKAEGFATRRVPGFEQAAALFRYDTHPVILLRLTGASQTALDFIEEFHRRGYESGIVGLTLDISASDAVRLMKADVFDLITTETAPAGMAEILREAFEDTVVKEARRKLKREKELRQKRNAGWEDLRKQVRGRRSNTEDAELFRNLKTSLNQGKGFGTMLSLTAMLEEMGERDGDSYRLPAELVDLLVENAARAGAALDRFEEIHSIMNDSFPLEPCELYRLYALLDGTVAEMAPFAQIKGQRIVMNEASEVREELKLDLNLDLLRKALRELLFNACKFSASKSTIYLITGFQAGYYRVSVLSRPSEELQMDDSNPKLFAPFFRMHQTVDERFPTLDFGLGLTLVDKVVKRHHGRTGFVRMADYFTGGEEGALRFSFSMELPVETSSDGARQNSVNQPRLAPAG